MGTSQVADTGRLVMDSSASTGAAPAEPGPTVEVAARVPPGHLGLTAVTAHRARHDSTVASAISWMRRP